MRLSSFAPLRELTRDSFLACFNKREAISRKGAKAQRRRREEDARIQL
jgi:hypothetical protein